MTCLAQVISAPVLSMIVSLRCRAALTSLLLLLGAASAWAGPGSREACLPSARLADPSAILRVHGPAQNGTDRSIEPFALLQMQAAAVWQDRRDEAAAERAVGELLLWARAGALVRIDDAGDARSNARTIAALRRTLIAVLGSWAELRTSPPGRAHAREIERWLADLFVAQNTPPGGPPVTARRDTAVNLTENALLQATLDAQWATIAGRPELADRAWRTARATIGEMRLDGSLPAETARGRLALWHQRQALASLVYLGELLRPLGHDLWQPRADGTDLHRGVSFLLRALEDPALLARYTGDVDARRQDLGFLKLRGNGRHYMAWAELYRARFPGREEARQLGRLLPTTGVAAWPLVDDQVGGNATCRVLSGTGDGSFVGTL